MDERYFAEFFDYNCWAHARVWECVLQLSDEAFRQDLHYSVGSIHDQLTHTLSVEHWWFTYLSTGALHFLDLDQLTTREAIRAQWDTTAAMIRAYLAQLTPAELAREVRPAFWPEGRRPIRVYQAITQVMTTEKLTRASTKTTTPPPECAGASKGRLQLSAADWGLFGEPRHAVRRLG